MTRDDIIQMGLEAGLIKDWMVLLNEDSDALARFAALVAAIEQEMCAKVCEAKMPQPVVNWADAQIVEALRDCAATIRARSNS